MRFKEINAELEGIKKWRNKRNYIDVEDIVYNEIKETEENRKFIEEAKEKEMKCFDEYGVYQQVPLTDQKVLGTRYVLTRKPDGRYKARFVVKGFQEKANIQSDSPTASRDSLKIFFCIAANEKWIVEGSDVRSAFLQSN